MKKSELLAQLEERRKAIIVQLLMKSEIKDEFIENFISLDADSIIEKIEGMKK